MFGHSRFSLVSVKKLAYGVFWMIKSKINVESGAEKSERISIVEQDTKPFLVLATLYNNL